MFQKRYVSFLFTVLLFLVKGFHCTVSVIAQGTDSLPASTAQTSDSSEITLEQSNHSKDAEHILENMTLRQKAAQLFIITPEVLTGVDTATAAREMTRDALSENPVGGLIYMGSNIVSEEQIKEMLASTQAYSLELTSLPLFLCVDEEGGQVARVSGRIAGVPVIGDMWTVGQSADPETAYSVGAEIGTYLTDLGFTVDFAPVADVVENPADSAIGNRSFGFDPLICADMIAPFVLGIQEKGVMATLKHFPGHGSVSSDTHTSQAVSQKTLDDLRECDLIPFQSGIDAGASFVMAGHLSFPAITGDNTPASLSHFFLTDLLRNEMGFQGLIVTDALNMNAVTDYYDSTKAAVMALNAGADLLLMPADFHAALQGVIDAVEDGTITEDRLNESVLRIIDNKLNNNY